MSYCIQYLSRLTIGRKSNTCFGELPEKTLTRTYLLTDQAVDKADHLSSKPCRPWNHVIWSQACSGTVPGREWASWGLGFRVRVEGLGFRVYVFGLTHDGRAGVRLVLQHVEDTLQAGAYTRPLFSST